MKKIAVLGHFAFGKDGSNGQTIKTKIIADTLRDLYGDESISRFDTSGKVKFLISLPFMLLKILSHYRNVLILPAYKGILIIAPLLWMLNLLFHRRLHYIVIGGWLPEYTETFPWLKAILKRYDYIYVETWLMADAMTKAGFKNIKIMPNFKPLKIVDDTSYHINQSPLKLCTFSRVRKDKGIADAVQAVRICNEKAGRTIYTLDIYGKVEEDDWFRNLMDSQPEYIKYKGIVPYDESVEVLRHYFALVFPTFYSGEGFPGTIIDAYASAVPVIGSDWKSVSYIVKEGLTGLLFPAGDIHKLEEILEKVSENPEILLNMRSNCKQEAHLYEPKKVISILCENLS